MPDDSDTLTERSQAIGQCLRQARQKRQLSTEECARLIGVSAERLASYESGQALISLPELEILAYALDIPLEHFLEAGMPQTEETRPSLTNVEQLLQLRHRVIGALLRKARLEAGLSLEELSQRSRIPQEQLQAYEFGQQPVPLPHLEMLCTWLRRSLREFEDQQGPVGRWIAQQRALRNFLSLPLELQVFVGHPSNRLYLELARRLSDMSVDKLRAVAEGLLEITY